MKTGWKRESSMLKWQTHEDAVLIEIWADAQPLKVNIGRLPGRTVRAAEAHAKDLQLPPRRLSSGISDDRPSFKLLWTHLRARRGTIPELAARCHLSRPTVDAFVKRFRSEMHVCGWRDRAAIYKAGAGIDVAKPARQTSREKCARYWKKLKRERPDLAARRIARARFKRLEREGKVMRRDPAVIALFGPATPDDDRRA